MRAWMVGQVARKEILSTVRDRRAIVSNLMIPLLLLPLLMLGLPLAIGGLFLREQVSVTKVAVAGLEQLPEELVSLIEEQNAELVASADPRAAVREDEHPVGLVVPDGFAAGLAAGERPEVVVYNKPSSLSSEVAADKVESAIEAYSRGLVAERLRSAGLDPALLEPIAVTAADASTEAERASGQLAWLIPFFIAVWTLTGGQMTAIDATAGEKERGTLEALLVAPVRRAEVVAGKFLATLLFGLAAATMAIVGYVLGGLAIRRALLPSLGSAASIVELMGGSLQITLPRLLLLLVSALLLAGVVAALLLGITLFARSFKEAQSYVAPLGLLMLLPALSLQFADLLDFGAAMYLVPVMNALLLMDAVVRGSVGATPVIITWASLALTIWLLLLFALRNFRREDVIFRS